MDFFDVIEARHSCRNFAVQDVEQEKVKGVLTAARLAPSAGDLQAFRIVIVSEPDRRARLADAAYGQGFIAQAPIVLAFLADERRSEAKYHDRGVRLFSVQDATIAAAYAQLAATALGLSSCWVGAFDEERISGILEAPPQLRPIALMPIGYAFGKLKGRSRRPLIELVNREQVDGRNAGRHQARHDGTIAG